MAQDMNDAPHRAPNYYPDAQFRRQDERDDAEFYSSPRLVVHIDDYAIGQVSAILAEAVPPHATILDLMSSWRSHLPNNIVQSKQRIIGLGLNAVELRENPQLDEYVVHNLNTEPQLPFAADSFDVVINTVSVQYLTHPVEVFRDVCRVLRPSGQFFVFFSNRMFPTKAVMLWQQLDETARVKLVQSYFAQSGYVDVSFLDRSGAEKPRNVGHNCFYPAPDPLYAVIGRKPQNNAQGATQ